VSSSQLAPRPEVFHVTLKLRQSSFDEEEPVEDRLRRQFL